MTNINKNTKRNLVIGGATISGGTAYVVYKIITSAAKVAFLFL